MNAVDATDREDRTDSGPAPSLLTIILDTNPHAWALLSSTLPLSKLIANLLVFINAHLAINHANKVAVIASHTQRALWLYPTPTPAKPSSNASNGHTEDTQMSDHTSTATAPTDNANKYRPFAHIEHALTTNIRNLISSTPPSTLSNTPSTMIAGALTTALTYISKQSLSAPSIATSTYTPPNPTGSFSAASATGTQGAPTGLTSRILVISVSGDLASQYIPIMNSIFACQRLHIPIDILKLAGDTVFLQQAADATGGIYMAPVQREKIAGVLQYLMMAYLPDQEARRWLVLPGEGEGVDFRAACFCHRRVVDVGFVCSICLSIFCEPLTDSTCLTCGTHLALANYGTKPVVVPKKKAAKKKKRLGGLLPGDSREGTPASGADTPGP